MVESSFYGFSQTYLIFKNRFEIYSFFNKLGALAHGTEPSPFEAHVVAFLAFGWQREPDLRTSRVFNL
jgi:hypothetical protein